MQHGVVRITAHLNAHIGKHMAVVFDVLPHLEFEWVFKPRFEPGQHFIHWQLHRRIGAVMAQWHISALPRLDTPTNAHQVGAHSIERCRFGVKGHAVCGFQHGQPRIKLRPSQNGFVTLVACNRNHGFGF